MLSPGVRCINPVHGGVGNGEPCTEGGAADTPYFRAGGAWEGPVVFIRGLLLKAQVLFEVVSGINLAVGTMLW